MDPRQALLDCLRAVIAGRKDEAREAWDAYTTWRGRGGFAPSYTPDELMAELSNYF